jgi:hypothetical protein
MKIALAPRGIAWAVWMKALFHEVCPETVNVRNVKNQPPPVFTTIAVFEVQNRIPVFCGLSSPKIEPKPLLYSLYNLYTPIRPIDCENHQPRLHYAIDHVNPS